MSPARRSELMKRIKSTNTGIELAVAAELEMQDVVFECYPSDLPGRPDFVFRESRLAVFIDGDFWHGWRLSLWEHKLTQGWRAKLWATRRRDSRNHARLRRAGWRVVRIWEHQIEKDVGGCVAKIVAALGRT